MSKENYFSDSLLKDKPKKRLALLLKEGSVTREKIAAWAVGEGQIEDKSITTEKLLDKSVTRSKIADWAVGRDQISDDAITNGKILDRSVSKYKIEIGGVALENLSPEVLEYIKNSKLDYGIKDISVSQTEKNGCQLVITTVDGNTKTLTIPLASYYYTPYEWPESDSLSNEEDASGENISLLTAKPMPMEFHGLNGLMSGEEKKKLNDIEANATADAPITDEDLEGILI